MFILICWHSYLREGNIEKLEVFLNKYSESDSVYWADIAKESIAKYKQDRMVLRGARFRENMTQKELAKRSGVSQENIFLALENGKRKIGKTF